MDVKPATIPELRAQMCLSEFRVLLTEGPDELAEVFNQLDQGNGGCPFSC